MKTGESGAEIRGPPRAGQKGRNAAVAWDGSLRYRAGECWLSVEGLLPFSNLGNEQGKQGGTAESNFTDPVLVDNTQGRGRFVLSPFRKWSGVFLMPPAPGKGVPL